MAGDGVLTFGALGGRRMSLSMRNGCFRKEPTGTPWLHKILPNLERLGAAQEDRLVFYAVRPAAPRQEGAGTWQYDDERRQGMRREALGSGMVDLWPELACFIPPAKVVATRQAKPAQFSPARSRN